MLIFGKTLGDYIHFARFFLIATAFVGIVRLTLSLAGVPIDIARWFSINAVGLIALIYFSVRVHTTGFGGYPQLLILLSLELLTGEIIIAGGIMLAWVTGVENIFSAPEFGGEAFGHATHAATHILLGPTVFALVTWIPASIILFVTKLVVKTPRGG
jgi:hypothetical protein